MEPLSLADETGLTMASNHSMPAPTTIPSRRKPPVIHVIIPIYNCEATIRECLDSVCQQQNRHFTDAIVGDRAQDSSADEATNFCGHDSHLKLWRSGVNGSPL